MYCKELLQKDKIDKIELISITPFIENKKWYFNLIYQINYTNGSIYNYIIYKVDNPFPIDNMKIDTTTYHNDFCWTEDITGIFLSSNGYYPLRMFQHPDTKEYYRIVIIKDPKEKEIKEITMEELEEHFGQKIKIVNNKEKD